MQKRTDLALEQTENFTDLPDGVTCTERLENTVKITKIQITNETGAKALQKPVGEYFTVEVPSFSDHPKSQEAIDAVAKGLFSLLPKTGSVLVVGLGNRDITPDALGPKTAERILATRQIGREIARVAGLNEVRSVAVLAPGVLGQTGIEVADFVQAVVKKIKPAAIIVIDALASCYLKRLGCTVQMSNAGIEPGAGVGNARREISFHTLGVPVVAIGVPTVVDGATLVADLTNGKGRLAEPEGRQMIVTPREIDLLIDRAAGLLAAAINQALHPDLEAAFITEMLA